MYVYVSGRARERETESTGRRDRERAKERQRGETESVKDRASSLRRETTLSAAGLRGEHGSKRFMSSLCH